MPFASNRLGRRMAGQKARRGSLTFRILAVNFAAPLVLVAGLLYLSQFRDNLIRAELETLKAQSQVFAAAITEGAVKPVPVGRPFLFARPEEIENLIANPSRRMVKRLGENSDNRIRLFDQRGRLIADSYQLIGPSGMVEVTKLDDGADAFPRRAARAVWRKLYNLLPHGAAIKPFGDDASNRIEDYPDALTGMKGKPVGTPWRDERGRIVLTAAAPIKKGGQVLGVVQLTRVAAQVESAMHQVRLDVFYVFLAALSVTFLLSVYLAGLIGRPLKRLARAAEAVRIGQGRVTEIPDLGYRGDEIGDLSNAMRAMTRALWDRMDTIERFAADVSHEIKNPLTSLRSAVETLAIVRTEADHDRLMAIITHDIERMDRLISDISGASRIDAELLRDQMGPVDLNALLLKLADAHQSHHDGCRNAIRLDLPHGEALVRGNEGRLAQVFENLITNALSFSQPGAPVTITVTPQDAQTAVTVDDEGPGIPENKLEAIFERFYTERPRHEAYGKHSGLGLSIARQIVQAHGGRLRAENRLDEAGGVRGARFTATLNGEAAS